MVFFFAHPVIFYALLLVLLGVSVFAIFSMGAEDKKARTKREQESEKLKAHTIELEETLQEIQKQAQEAAVQAKAKEDSLLQRISGLEEQLQAAQGIKSAMTQLTAELAAKDEVYNQTAHAKQDLEEKIKAVHDDLEKTKKELTLSNQMYNGLKGQYDELEEKFSQVIQQAEQKTALPARPVTPLPESPAAVPTTKPPVDTGTEAAVPPTPASPASAFKIFKIPNLRGSVQENGHDNPSSPAGPAPT